MDLDPAEIHTVDRLCGDCLSRPLAASAHCDDGSYLLEVMTTALAAVGAVSDIIDYSLPATIQSCGKQSTAL